MCGRWMPGEPTVPGYAAPRNASSDRRYSRAMDMDEGSEGSGQTGGLAEDAERYALAASFSPKLQDAIVRAADLPLYKGGSLPLVLSPHDGPAVIAEADRAVGAMPRAFSRRRHSENGHSFYGVDAALVEAVRRARADRLGLNPRP